MNGFCVRECVYVWWLGGWVERKRALPSVSVGVWERVEGEEELPTSQPGKCVCVGG